MTYLIDETHDAGLTSWIDSANGLETDFPPQNLPFCAFQTTENESRIGIGVGDQILDLRVLISVGVLPESFGVAVQGTRLNGLMSLSTAQRRDLRKRISNVVTDSKSIVAADAGLRKRALIPQSAVVFHLPAVIGDYSDFYASLFHATNVGSMFRPDNALLPNYKHIPIGYHGRASSIVISGTDVTRPSGQLSPATDGGSPTFGQCQMLDYELEVGFWIGQGNRLGDSIPLDRAEEHLFGVGLVNDWSARDMQKWEYQPLGPFLAKNFATSVSPWVVSMEALAPFRGPAFQRPTTDPQPLPYLTAKNNETSGGIVIELEVLLASEKMRTQRLEPIRMSCSTFANMYWTAAQMLTHHASNGCNLQPGDLIGSGTVSGPERTSRGCMLELTWNGEYGKPVPGNQRTPLELPTGEKRTFLVDGDEITFRGSCQREGFRRIGFGECRGVILPAKS